MHLGFQLAGLGWPARVHGSGWGGNRHAYFSVRAWRSVHSVVEGLNVGDVECIIGTFAPMRRLSV